MELTLPSIIVRLSVMYLFALAMVRLSGKQSIGELATMDFVVVTILGDGIDTVIYGEVPLMNGVVYLSTLVCLHLLVSQASSRSNQVFRLVNSPARLMVHNGMVQGSSLQAERMRPEDVASHMREKGADQLQEVKEAWLWKRTAGSALSERLPADRSESRILNCLSRIFLESKQLLRDKTMQSLEWG